MRAVVGKARYEGVLNTEREGQSAASDEKKRAPISDSTPSAIALRAMSSETASEPLSRIFAGVSITNIERMLPLVWCSWIAAFTTPDSNGDDRGGPH